MENRTSKKRICLALGFVTAEDAITKIIDNRYRTKYEIAQNVRSKEALLDTILKEKYEIIILREDLPGNTDLIEILKTIRSENENTQIIFFMNNRQNGDPFFIELFLFNIYDFVVLPNIKLDEVFGFLENPRKFKDIVRYLPIRPERTRNLIIEANKDLKAPLKMDKDGDVDEVFDISIGKNKNNSEPQIKEIIKYVEKPIVREIIKEVPVPVNMPAQGPATETSVEPTNTVSQEIGNKKESQEIISNEIDKETFKENSEEITEEIIKDKKEKTQESFVYNEEQISLDNEEAEEDDI